MSSNCVECGPRSRVKHSINANMNHSFSFSLSLELLRHKRLVGIWVLVAQRSFYFFMAPSRELGLRDTTNSPPWHMSLRRERKKNNKMNNTVKNGINEVRLRDRLKLLDYVWEARKTFWALVTQSAVVKVLANRNFLRDDHHFSVKILFKESFLF